MSADRREYPKATNFEAGRQNLRIANAGATTASPEPGAPRPNLYVVFENLDGTDSFHNTVFMTGRPIRTMHIFVTKLYTACGLKPYDWKDRLDPNEGYLAVLELFGKTVDAKVDIRLAKDNIWRPEITELYDPQTEPKKDDPKADSFFDDDIPDFGDPEPPPAEPPSEPEPKLDLKSLAYHMHIVHNYLAEYFLEIYRILVNQKDKSDVGLLAIEEKLNNQFKKVRADLKLTQGSPSGTPSGT